MLSLFSFGGHADTMSANDYDDPEYLFDPEVPLHPMSDMLDILRLSESDMVPPDKVDLARGDVIDGFDPARDVIELEYSGALETPDVSVRDFDDGSGASVSLNGVVVAEVEGAAGLDASSILLRPV